MRVPTSLGASLLATLAVTVLVAVAAGGCGSTGTGRLHFRLGRLPPAAVPSASEELVAPELDELRALKKWKRTLKKGVVDESGDIDADAARREKRRRRRRGGPLPAE